MLSTYFSISAENEAQKPPASVLFISGSTASDLRLPQPGADVRLQVLGESLGNSHCDVEVRGKSHSSGRHHLPMQATQRLDVGTGSFNGRERSCLFADVLELDSNGGATNRLSEGIVYRRAVSAESFKPRPSGIARPATAVQTQQWVPPQRLGRTRS